MNSACAVRRAPRIGVGEVEPDQPAPAHTHLRFRRSPTAACRHARPSAAGSRAGGCCPSGAGLREQAARAGGGARFQQRGDEIDEVTGEEAVITAGRDGGAPCEFDEREPQCRATATGGLVRPAARGDRAARASGRCCSSDRCGAPARRWVSGRVYTSQLICRYARPPSGSLSLAASGSTSAVASAWMSTMPLASYASRSA